MGIAAITLSTSLVTLFNATILGSLLLKRINLGYKKYFYNLIKMLIAAILTFGLNYILYINWQIDSSSWLSLAIRTFVIFALSMTTYIIFAALLKIEYVGELIERVRNYIRQKFVK